MGKRHKYKCIGDFYDFVTSGKNYHYTISDEERNRPFPGYDGRINLNCPIHGTFSVRISSFKCLSGCYKCGRKTAADKQRFSLEYFISEVHKKFPGRFDLSGINYVNQKSRVTVKCLKHGPFSALAGKILLGQGCKKCRYEKMAETRTTKFKDFILKANKIYGTSLYDYSESNYVNMNTKIKIKCLKHGVYFYQEPSKHLIGTGCEHCEMESRIKSRTMTTEEFIVRAREIHGNKYGYSKTQYKHHSVPVNIICKKHGEFLQKPIKHLSGHGCPICKTSSGEREIHGFLEKNLYNFRTQYKFFDCANINLLRFDFAILDNNKVKCLIEYQGRQHYEPVDYFGGLEGLKNTRLRDKIKYNYCKEHNIPLYYITYKDNIEDKLKEFLEIKDAS